MAVRRWGEELCGELLGGCVVPLDVCAGPVSADGGFGLGAVGCVDEGEVTDASGTLRDEAGSEGAVGESGVDGPVGAGGLDLAGRGGLEADAEVVEAAGSGESGFEGCVEDAFTGFEQLPGVREGEALEEVFGRDAGPAGEEAVEVKRAEAGFGGERLQGGLLGVVLVEKVNDFGDALELIHGFILGRCRMGFPPDSCATVFGAASR